MWAALVLYSLLLGCFVNPMNPRRPETVWSDPKVIALAKAIDKGDLKQIDELVAEGADINAKGADNQMNILAWAMGTQNTAVFERLLELGADPNQSIRMFGPITSACAHANTSKWLKIVLNHGGDPNVETQGKVYGGQTPIFDAIRGRDKENLELLIKSGADINHRDHAGNTPLIHAAARNWFDSVYYLLEAGADYRIKDNYGYDLGYEVIDTTVDPDSEQWRWRDKVVDFLEERDFDFGPSEQKAIEQKRPSLERWKVYMQRRNAVNK